MRRLFAFILLSFSCQILLGQLIDSAYIRVDYLVKSKNFIDTRKASEDWFNLDANANASMFYSTYQKIADSTFENLSSKGLSIAEIFERTKDLKQGSPDIIYKDFANNLLTFVSEIYAKKYSYAEDIVRQNWQLSDDTLNILGYCCNSAKCRFRGRDWTVWYTPQIPLSNGPWKFNGLPGLILKAEDSKGDFIYESKGIRLLKTKVPIILPFKDNKNRIIKTDGKTYQQIKRKSIEDVKGVIASQGMTIVSVTDANGNISDVPSMLMNAIEIYE